MESGVTAITAGEYFSCGIKNGAIKCWGSIGYSSLNAPVADGPAAFTFIEAGNGHFLAK
jgi:hypothetical protein